jgi:hypothetical protein
MHWCTWWWSHEDRIMTVWMVKQISECRGNPCAVTVRSTHRYEDLPSSSRKSGAVVPAPERLHRTVGSLWNTAAVLSEAPDCSAMGWAALVLLCLLVPVGKDLQHVQVGYTYRLSYSNWTTWPLCTVPNSQSQSQSQSQSYCTTGGLRPISSSWRQAPWHSRPELFSTEHLLS